MSAGLVPLLLAACNQAKEAKKGIYTGIFQFPKKLNKDWNLINRVIWTVPSMPLDEDKIDDFELGSGLGGAPMPPSGSPPAPIDPFDGRTTGFGDMYYLGLFAPSEGTHILNGKFLWGAGAHWSRGPLFRDTAGRCTGCRVGLPFLHHSGGALGAVQLDAVSGSTKQGAQGGFS